MSCPRPKPGGETALLLAALGGCAGSPEPPDAPAGQAVNNGVHEGVSGDTKAPRHVVFIVVDTLRADVMERANVPNLRALAAEGRSPALTWAAGTWTVPSVVSMFTGAYIGTHGWDFPFPRFMDKDKETYAQVPDLPLLAEVLHEADFDTLGLYNNVMLDQGLGLDRGFDRWEHIGDRKMGPRLAEEVAEWPQVGDLGGDRQFVYLHLLGPHHPLRPSRPAAKRWGLRPRQILLRNGLQIEDAQAGGPAAQANYRAGYYAVVEDTDVLVGEVLAALGPHAADTLVVLTSDHGELLGEHELVGHEQWVFEPLTRVPLVVRGGEAPLPERFSTAMIPDLITRSLGVAHDWPLRLESEVALNSQRQGKLAITQDGNIKGIWDDESIGSGFGAFDLRVDPGETKTVPRFPATAARLHMARAALRLRHGDHQLAAAPASMGAELLQALEALGYMGEVEPEAPTEAGE